MAGIQKGYGKRTLVEVAMGRFQVILGHGYAPGHSSLSRREPPSADPFSTKCSPASTEIRLLASC